MATLAAVAFYLVGWVLTRRRRMPLRVALAIAVAVQILPLAAPMLLSKDAYLYWAVSRIETVHHANPYRATIGDFPNDPSSSYPSESWRSYPAAYGPAWETIGVLPGAAAGTSADRAQLFYRIFAVIGILLILSILAARTRDPAAVALVGWCPLVAFHYAGGGHSDAWMMAVFLVGVTGAATAGRGAAWAIAGSFKPVAVILLPLELARTRLRESRAWWMGIVVTTVAISAAATAVFGHYWLTEQVVGIHRGSGYPTPLGLVHWLTQAGVAHSRAVLLAGAVFAVFYLALFRDSWATGRSRLGLAAAGLVLTSTLIGPWYGLWPLVLAGAESDVAGGAAAAALSAYLLLADALPL